MIDGALMGYAIVEYAMKCCVMIDYAMQYGRFPYVSTKNVRVK